MHTVLQSNVTVPGFPATGRISTGTEVGLFKGRADWSRYIILSGLVLFFRTFYGLNDILPQGKTLAFLKGINLKKSNLAKIVNYM